MQTPVSGSRLRGALASAVAIAAVAFGTMVVASDAARAETQISVYGGANWNFSSKLENSAAGDTRTLGWDGKPFQMPPYWGARGTYWFNNGPGWGIALDYAHAKAYGKVNFATDPVYEHLEFTDGMNLLNLNAMYRWGGAGDKWVPYVGLGVGVSIPHVEVTMKAPNPTTPTFEYQLGGMSAQAIAGIEYNLSPSWSIFTEAKLSYAQIDADITGGSLKTNIWSPQVAVGLTYRFGN